MQGFAHRLVYQSRQHGDYGPSLKRGVCSVEHDGRVYQYRVHRGERRQFKDWFAEASQTGLTGYRVSGHWPYYRLERVG